MHPVLLQLGAEHRDMGSLLTLLRRQRSLLADPLASNIGLLVDALYYLTSFPDVTHHPLEDRIAERLLHKLAIDPDLVREHETQHDRLGRQGQDLLRDLEGAAREESMSRELVAANICLYVERLRHNMAFEELVLFPAAARHLDDQDWRAIAAGAARAAPDPLFDPQVQHRFQQLRNAITLEAVGTEADPGDAFCKHAG
jgi:hemerythrin-like domain-containing protein